MNKKLKQILLVHMPDEKCYEYPVSDGRRLGDEFTDLGLHFRAVAQLAFMGLHPCLDRGKVYGYILNRRPEFEHKYYGWALPRSR